MRVIFRKFTEFINNGNNNEKICKYCKNRITTYDGNRLYSDRCKKFTVKTAKSNEVLYELAYHAKKDETKCGSSGKYYEDKYFSKKQ